MEIAANDGRERSASEYPDKGIPLAEAEAVARFCAGKNIVVKYGGVLCVRRRRGEPDLGFVGEIERTDASLLELLLSGGFVPVIATIGADARGGLFNINADTAAAAIAGALRAEKLILMTDVRGVLADPDDASSLLETLRADEARDLIARGAVRGGMIPKLLCCVAAVEDGGLREASVIDGRAPRALLRALSPEGCGTRVVATRGD